MVIGTQMRGKGQREEKSKFQGFDRRKPGKSGEQERGAGTGEWEKGRKRRGVFPKAKVPRQKYTRNMSAHISVKTVRTFRNDPPEGRKVKLKNRDFSR